MAGGNESGGSGGGGGDAETTNAALRSWEEVLGPRIQAMLGGRGGGEEGGRAPGGDDESDYVYVEECQEHKDNAVHAGAQLSAEPSVAARLPRPRVKMAARKPLSTKTAARAEHGELARLRGELATLRTRETSRDVEVETYKRSEAAAREELGAFQANAESAARASDALSDELNAENAVLRQGLAAGGGGGEGEGETDAAADVFTLLLSTREQQLVAKCLREDLFVLGRGGTVTAVTVTTAAKEAGDVENAAGERARVEKAS